MHDQFGACLIVIYLLDFIMWRGDGMQRCSNHRTSEYCYSQLFRELELGCRSWPLLLPVIQRTRAVAVALGHCHSQLFRELELWLTLLATATLSYSEN